jgi:hypothetical protein
MMGREHITRVVARVGIVLRNEIKIAFGIGRTQERRINVARISKIGVLLWVRA